MADQPTAQQGALTNLEAKEHRLPEFLLLAKAKERLAVEKISKAAAKVKHAIEKAAPYPASD